MQARSPKTDHIQNFLNFQQEQFHLTKKECEAVTEYFQVEPFAKNEYFVSQGKVCRKLAFIAEGVMRYCMFRDDGTDVTCFLCARMILLVILNHSFHKNLQIKMCRLSPIAS